MGSAKAREVMVKQIQPMREVLESKSPFLASPIKERIIILDDFKNGNANEREILKALEKQIQYSLHTALALCCPD